MNFNRTFIRSLSSSKTIWTVTIISSLTFISTQILEWSGTRSIAAICGQIVIILVARAQIVQYESQSREERSRLAHEELRELLKFRWEEFLNENRLRSPVPLEVDWQEQSGVAPICDKKDGLTSDTEPIYSRWNDLHCKQLIIVGEAGAGKTSLAAILAHRIMSENDPDDLVPIHIPLASWNPRNRGDFGGWLSSYLTQEYSILSKFSRGRRRDDIARYLLDNHLILPILDGLDETDPHDLELAIDGIRKYSMEMRPVILTCRMREYCEAMMTSPLPLCLAVTVKLMPVSPEKLGQYVQAYNQGGSRNKWAGILQDLRQDPKIPAAKVFGTPLMISLACAAHEGGKLDDPQTLCNQEKFPEESSIRDFLFDSFLDAVYDPQKLDDECPWDAKSARGWLGFLARLEACPDGSNFAWWRLRHALPGRWIVGIVAGVTVGVPYGIVTGIGEKINVRAGIGLFPGVVLALTVGLTIRRRVEAHAQSPSPSVARHPDQDSSISNFPSGHWHILRRWKPHVKALVCARSTYSGLTGGAVGGLLGGLAAGIAGQNGIGHSRTLYAAFPAALGVAVWAGPGLGFTGALAGCAIGGFGAGYLVEVGKGTITADLATGSAVALGVGTAVMLAEARPPTQRLCFSVMGLPLGLACALGAGLVSTTVVGPWKGMGIAVVTGLVVALAAGITRTCTVTAEGGPRESLSGDRRASIITGATLGAAGVLVSCVVAGSSTVFSHGLGDGAVIMITNGIAVGLVVGLGVGVMFFFNQAAWGHYLASRCFLSLKGDLPWRLNDFLDYSRSHGVLRQVGSVYQFRHAGLRQYLARHATPMA